MLRVRSLRRLLGWLAPALVIGSPACGGEEEAGGGGEHAPAFGGGIGGSTYADAGTQPSPFADGGAGGAGAGGAGGGSAPCDESQAGPSACDAPGASSCLTPVLCAQLGQTLSPRTAAVAAGCVASLAPQCSAAEIGACVAFAAQLACAAAPAGTPPCDVLEALCAGGDPFGAVPTCLAMASVLEASAASGLGACLEAEGLCDPGALETCVATLFE